MTQQRARIKGMGSYLPEKVLSNADLEKMVETNDEWITTRTGMKERRLASDDEFSSDLALHAAKRAIDASGITADEIDLVIVATITPDYVFPSTAALVQSALGIEAAAMDLQAACSGFLYGLSTAKAFVESGIYRNVLLIASEKLSSIVDYEDRSTCILFGDGAAAAVVGDQGSGFRIEEICLGAEGKLGNLLHMPAGGCRASASHETVEQRQHFIKMEGREVFKHAVRRMESAAKECLERAGMEESQIDWMVPHQANIRIIDAMAKRFSLPDERVYKTVHKYGNTSASALPIALDELLREEEIQLDSHLLLVAFGAGFGWGASILKKVES